MSAYFITSSGTDCGKTYVTSLLCRKLRENSRHINALKPLISGYNPEALHTSDSAILLTALGREVTPLTIESISPWRFRAPLAPPHAASLEGKTIDFERVIAWCQHHLITAPETITFIEGAGGILSPFASAHTNRDATTALAIPSILVVGTYLGSISHTLCTYEAMLSHNIPLAAIILNESTSSSLPLEVYADELARFLPHNQPIYRLARHSLDILPASGQTPPDILALLRE